MNGTVGEEFSLKWLMERMFRVGCTMGVMTQTSQGKEDEKDWITERGTVLDKGLFIQRDDEKLGTSLEVFHDLATIIDTFQNVPEVIQKELGQSMEQALLTQSQFTNELKESHVTFRTHTFFECEKVKEATKHVTIH